MIEAWALVIFLAQVEVRDWAALSLVALECSAAAHEQLAVVLEMAGWVDDVVVVVVVDGGAGAGAVHVGVVKHVKAVVTEAGVACFAESATA